MDARIAPPFMEATDASRLVCVVVVSYQEYSLTHSVCECVCVSGGEGVQSGDGGLWAIAGTDPPGGRVR